MPKLARLTRMTEASLKSGLLETYDKLQPQLPPKLSSLRYEYGLAWRLLIGRFNIKTTED
ncbi:hypothetical protein [Rubripirellula reticaptiva]|nr:hypothetical protein [Rubripirellula reticaptiva]